MTVDIFRICHSFFFCSLLFHRNSRWKSFLVTTQKMMIQKNCGAIEIKIKMTTKEEEKKRWRPSVAMNKHRTKCSIANIAHFRVRFICHLSIFCFVLFFFWHDFVAVKWNRLADIFAFLNVWCILCK